MEPHPGIVGRIPPEIWSTVFECLGDDPTSLHSCFNACYQGNWYELLFDERTKFLFPLVISILSGHLERADLVSLRSVCKTWKSAVDTNLNEISTYFPVSSTAAFRNVHEPEDEWFKNTIGTTFNHPDQIERFLNQMQDCRENPFVNRTVKLVENEEVALSPEEKIQLYRSFTRLIERHGEHIWTCVYYAAYDPECNRQMHKLFQNLRNLRCLTIKKLYFWGDENDPEYEEMMESIQWMRRPHLLPPLEHLKSLNLFLDSKRLCQLLLYRFGGQLESLQVELDAVEHCPFFNELPINRQGLENLRALKLIGFYGDSSLLNRISVFHLPRMERLHLNYSEVGRRPSSLKSVLRLINKFSTTLTELRMPFNLFNLEDNFQAIYGDGEDAAEEFLADVDIKLPLVKWIGFPYSYVGYSLFHEVILEKFPNLEEIHIMDFDVYYRDKMIECEELHEQTDHFWEKVPKLKKITVEEDRTNNIVFQSSRELVDYRKSMRTYSPLNMSLQSSDDSDSE